MKKLLEILNNINDSIDWENEKALIDDCILDIYDVKSLAEKLEDTFNIKLSGSEAIPENFQSVQAIWNMINKLERKRKMDKNLVEEEHKTLAKKCALIDREKKRQELQVSIINQAEDCLKIFKRYLDFLNDKDYIKLEKIKSSTEQFIEIYEKLFDLDSETPKRLGSLFRSVKIAFNLILFLENNLAYHLIDFNKKELERNIEIIEAEILRRKAYFRGRGVL